METSRLTLLPVELQCEIYKYPMTLKEFKDIRQTSTQTKAIVDDCVEVLEEGDDIESVNASLILSLPNLRSMSPLYEIVVHSEEELLALARHPRLKECAIDLSIFNDRYDEEDYYDLIIPFFQAYMEAHPEDKGNTCSDCNLYNPSYKFLFLFTDEDNTYSVEISQGSIIFDTYQSPSFDFVTEIIELVPICSFKGSSTLVIILNTFLCLDYIDLEFNGMEVDRGELAYLIELFQKSGISEYHMQLVKTDEGRKNYKDLIQKLLVRLNRNNIIYPLVTAFFPVDIMVLPGIHGTRAINVLFPNLTSISLTLSSVSRVYQGLKKEKMNMTKYNQILSILNNYSQIYVVDDIEIKNKQERLSIFPGDLRSKVSLLP